MASLVSQLSEVGETLLSVADVLEERVENLEPPAGCQARGWLPFLNGLSDQALGFAEEYGLAKLVASRADAPPTLKTLAQSSVRLAHLPRVDSAALIPSQAALKAVNARKRQQLGVLLGALEPMARPAVRVVDVGSGHGHLTRLASDFFARDALGIERSVEHVKVAQRRVAERDAEQNTRSAASFEVVDACKQGLSLRNDDLAVGLHACGELGDQLVLAAGQAGSDVALVSCCLQKISTPVRHPLSSAGTLPELSRQVLGLTNLTARAAGVEASLEEMLNARTTRYALRRLLAARGVALEAGAEMRGINRRKAHAGLRVLAGAACALRSLTAASAEEIGHFEREAREHQAVMRRWALPRHMLARLLEIAVALDRGRYLEECGFEVRLLTLFELSVSPRNIALFASRVGTRLPAVLTS